MNFWRLLNARIRAGRIRVLAVMAAVAALTAAAVTGLAETMSANPLWDIPAGVGGALIAVTVAAYGQIWAATRVGRWAAGVSRQVRRSILGAYFTLEPAAMAEIDKDAALDALVAVPRGLEAQGAEAPAALQSFLSSLACIVVTLLIDPVAGAAMLLTLKLGAIAVTALIIRARGGKVAADTDDARVERAADETLRVAHRSVAAAPQETALDAAIAARRTGRARGLAWAATEGAAGAVGRPLLGALLVAVTRLAGEAPDQAAAMLLIAFLVPLDWIASVPRLASLSAATDRLAAFEAALHAAARRWPAPAGAPNGTLRSIGLQDAIFHYPALPGQPGAIIGPVSCSVAAGEILFVTGEAGAGKTSLLAMLAGLARPEAGLLLRNGDPADARRGRDPVAFVAADPALFAGMRIPAPERDLIQWLIEELDLGGLDGIGGGRIPDPAGLPVSVRPRIALLLAVASDRPLLLLDEWDMTQSVIIRERFYGAILPRLRESGRAVVVSTRDERYAHMASAAVRLRNGRQVGAAEPGGGLPPG